MIVSFRHAGDTDALREMGLALGCRTLGFRRSTALENVRDVPTRPRSLIIVSFRSA
jgi:hypothetical protein